MKTIFRKSFERDLKRIKDRSVLEQAEQVIEEVEAAASLHEVNGVEEGLLRTPGGLTSTEGNTRNTRHGEGMSQ